MSDMPERIWALADRRKHWQEFAPEDGQKPWHWEEYVRADLPPTREQLAALVRPIAFDDRMECKTPFGTYNGTYIGGSWALSFNGEKISSGVEKDFKDHRGAIAAIKTATQADYTRRLLSAFDIPEGA